MTCVLSILTLVIPLLAKTPTPQKQTASLHISGYVQSAETTKINFGRLPRHYRGASWAITSNDLVATKIPLARLLQEIHVGPGITILDRTTSISIVQEAQGRDPLTAGTRISTGVLAGFSSCESLRICPQGGSWPRAVIGAQFVGLFFQFVIPTLRSHAVQSVADFLPDPITIDSLGTAKGMIIVELDGKVYTKKTADPSPLDTTVTITTCCSTSEGVRE